MGVQEKDWGSIQWMENGNDGLFQKGLNVGIVTLRCGAHQRPHTHYEEQVFYVIHGQATSIINGESVEMTPGQFFRWPAGVIHEIFNTGDIPFQHLLISNPTSIDLDNLQQEKKISGNLTEEELDDLFFMAIEAVRTQFLEMLNYSYVIFDRRGEVVLESKYRVEFCATHCKIDKKTGKLSLYTLSGG